MGKIYGIDEVMEKSIGIEIKNNEDRLRQAMLESDVTVLDELLSSDLIFTNHLGQLMTKKDDLNAHRTGTLKISEIINSDQKVSIYGNFVVVFVQTHIVGSFAGVVSVNDFRFTRVWNKTTKDAWQIVAGHSSIVI